MSRGSVLATLTLAAVASTTVSGCAAGVSVTPAPHAADPVCARVLNALPARVAGGDQRPTTAQATTAWGDPPVVLRCGVTPLGPTTALCEHVESAGGTRVDWVVGTPRSGRVSWTTFGRVPAVQLIMPDDSRYTLAAPIDVGDAVRLTKHVASCPS